MIWLIEEYGMLGKRLKRLRVENGLTQITLGEIAGVSNVQIARYENGSSKPRDETLAKLAKVLRVDPDFFTCKKRFPEEICLEVHIERLKEVVKTDDDRKMLIALIEILHYKNKFHYKKQNFS